MFKYKKKYSIIIFIISVTNSFCQVSFKQIWGDIGNVGGRIKTCAIHPQTNDLYYINDVDPYSDIWVYNFNTGKPKMFYMFPRKDTIVKPQDHDPFNASVIEKIMFDNKNDLIVYGRMHNDTLGTVGVYSQFPLPQTKFSGHTFISKIGPNGKIKWFTYFHDLDQNKNNLTIDLNNNIYVIN